MTTFAAPQRAWSRIGHPVEPLLQSGRRHVAECGHLIRRREAYQRRPARQIFAGLNLVASSRLRREVHLHGLIRQHSYPLAMVAGDERLAKPLSG